MKISTSVGVALLVAGILLVTAASGLSGWSFASFGTKPELTYNEYVSDKVFESINFTDNNTDIRIELSADDKLHIGYYASDLEYFDIDESGSLTFKRKNDLMWYNYMFNFDITRDSHITTILVPADFFGKLDIKTDNGKIEASGNYPLSGFKAETDNGSITLKSMDIRGDVDIRTSNGALVLEGVAADDVKARTSNGAISCDGIAAKDIECRTSNGVVDVSDIKAVGRIELKTSNNRIEVDGLDFGESALLEAGNGSISGTVLGRTVDYTIKSKTSNGDNNLPASLSGGDKKLEVYTSNGRIDITFTED